MDTIKVENEQLIKRHEIKDTPFTIVEIEGEFFGSMGQYRLTEKYETYQEAHDAVTANTLNNITNLIITIHEILKNNAL
jgi:hypothetical protein